VAVQKERKRTAEKKESLAARFAVSVTFSERGKKTSQGAATGRFASRKPQDIGRGEKRHRN